MKGSKPCAAEYGLDALLSPWYNRTAAPMPLHPPMMRFTFQALLFAFALGAVRAAAQGTAESIHLTANADSLPANGFSTTVITAEVRDRSAFPVPDGTEVRFAATVGSLSESSVPTRSGRARVTFTAASVPGVATITASSGRAVRTISVLMYTPGEKPPETRICVITISGDYVAYSSDYQVLAADGRVRIALGSLEIKSDSAQLDLLHSTVRARSAAAEAGVEVTSGATTWHVGEAWYDWTTRSGAVRRASAPPNGLPDTFAFSGPPLTPAASGDINPAAFEFRDIEDTSFWITSRWAAIFPGQRIHFRAAEIRPAGARFLKLPYHSLALTEGPDADQYLGIGTTGLTLDIPYYFSLTEKSASSVRLGLNQREGSLGAVKGGWGLDLRHRIFVGDRGEETINLSRFTSRDWGLWWKHSRQWSPTVATNAFVDYPSHRDLFATATVDWEGTAYSGFLGVSANVPKGFGASYYTDLGLQTHPKRIGRSRLTYSFVSSTDWSGGAGVSDEIRHALSLRVALPALHLSGRTSLSTSLTAGRILTGSRPGGTTDAVISLSHRFSPTTYLSTNYTYQYRPTLSRLSSRQRVGLMFASSHGRTSLSAAVSKALDTSSLAVAGDYWYSLSPLWRVSLRATLFRQAGYTFSDQEVSVGYTIGTRELIVYWSRSRHRFMIELGGFSF
ncbi:MAG: invasin domain 3-containing protein [Armatimonadota bacterium]